MRYQKGLQMAESGNFSTQVQAPTLGPQITTIPTIQKSGTVTYAQQNFEDMSVNILEELLANATKFWADIQKLNDKNKEAQLREKKWEFDQLGKEPSLQEGARTKEIELGVHANNTVSRELQEANLPPGYRTITSTPVNIIPATVNPYLDQIIFGDDDDEDEEGWYE